MDFDKIPEIFQYTRPAIPNDCIHSISPSQIANFFSLPRVWYEDNMLDGEKAFQGNTATVTGTIAHHIYKYVTLGKKITREEINEQLAVYAQLRPELSLDTNQIMIDYPLVTTEVVNNYIIPHDKQGGMLKVEESVVAPVMPGIYVGGTYDRLEGDCIVDFKTVGTKPNENAIPFNYKIQLLAYAFALRATGHEVNRIRLVYGVKPTVKIPVRCIVVTESIDYVAEKLISDTLKLIGESVLMVLENPSLTHLIFKSMDLKQ
jgi:hypothetical protein